MDIFRQILHFSGQKNYKKAFCSPNRAVNGWIKKFQPIINFGFLTEKNFFSYFSDFFLIFFFFLHLFFVWRMLKPNQKPIFCQNFPKTEYLHQFSSFLELLGGASLTLNNSFWAIYGAKNIDFSKIVQYVPKCVSRVIFRLNFHFSAFKNSKTPF